MRTPASGRSPAVKERLPKETPPDGAPLERWCIDDAPKISPIV